MYVNNIEPEMFLPPGSESFNHNATRTTSSRSRSNNVNNNIVPVYGSNPQFLEHFSVNLARSAKIDNSFVQSVEQSDFSHKIIKSYA